MNRNPVRTPDFHGRPCPPGCACGRHHKSAAHRARIGIGVMLTATAKRTQREREMQRAR